MSEKTKQQTQNKKKVQERGQEKGAAAAAAAAAPGAGIVNLLSEVPPAVPPATAPAPGAAGGGGGLPGKIQLNISKSQSHPPGQAFSTRLHKLYADFGSLQKDTAGFQAYDHVCSRITQLNIDKQKKDETLNNLQAEFEQLKRDNEAVVRSFEARFKAWDANRSQHIRDVEELKTLRISSKRSEAKAHDATQHATQLQYAADTYKQEAKSLEADVASLKDKLELKSIHMRQKNDELHKCKETLKIVQNDLGRLALNPGKARDAFDKLASQIHDIIWSHFNQAIPDPAAPIHITGPLSRIPLVPSESQAARCMRCAFAEAVVAQQLSISIFRDEYPVDQDAEVHLSGLFQSLKWIDRTHPALGTVIRCQIAKISDESEAVSVKPAQAADAVREVLGPWLRGDLEREEEIMDSLRVVFLDALLLWKDLQKTAQRAEAFVEIDGPIWDPATDLKPDYDNIPADVELLHPSPYSLEQPTAVLFPKIYVGVEDDGCDASDGDDDLLYHGWALFSTQASVMAATKEWTQSQPYQRPIRRRASEHSRRSSVLLPNNKDVRVNGVPPPSPGMARGETSSYSQRVASIPRRDGTTNSTQSNRSQRSGSVSGVSGM